MLGKMVIGMKRRQLFFIGVFLALQASCQTQPATESAMVPALVGDWYDAELDSTGRCKDVRTRFTANSDGTSVTRTWMSGRTDVAASGRTQVWTFHRVNPRTGSSEFCLYDSSERHADPGCKSKVAARMLDPNTMRAFFWTESDSFPPAHGAEGIWHRCLNPDGTDQ